MTFANAPAPAWLTRGRIPSLDGVRALAVVLVLYAHAQHSVNFPAIPKPYWIGWLGVNIFFALSGFLITTLMVREFHQNARLDVPAFYLRRSLRILPAYAVYLAAVLLLQTVGTVSLSDGDWLRALTYTVNFQEDPPWLFAHIWSLSVEEHFYLAWPLVMALGLSRGLRGALAVVVGCFAMRWGLMLAGSTLVPMNNSSLTRLDAIAAGCLLALLAHEPVWRARLDRVAAHPFLLLAAVAFPMLVRPLTYKVAVGLGYSLNAFGLAGLLWLAVRREHSWFGRLLNARLAQVIGIGSYSIYLWQQPFLAREQSVFWCRFPQNLGFALLAGFLSYQLIEKPFLRLKTRLTEPASTAAAAAITPRLIQAGKATATRFGTTVAVVPEGEFCAAMPSEGEQR